ncbi:MAG TPA: ABC transporter permease subunit [Pseudobacteroides sp.]|nr:ABC transporter permease subunit [Pseudobacteroides sp.]
MITIAFTTFKEALRKKMLYLIGALSVIYILLFTLIVRIYVNDFNRGGMNMDYMNELASQIISVTGFYFSSMLVALLTIMSSIGSISSEIENGTIHSIISKPIKRYEYILGKYIGLGIISTAYATILFVLVIIIPKISGMPVSNLMDMPSIIKGWALFILEPLAILSLSIFGSSVFRTLTNGIMVVAIYILGLIGSMMEQIGSMIGNDGLYKFGILSSLISPFDLIYRKMISMVFSDAVITNPLSGGFNTGATSPSIWMMVYIGVYLVGLLVWAVKRFRKRDIS